MSGLIAFCVMVGVAVTLAYRNSALWAWTGASAVALIYLSQAASGLGLLWVLLGWLLWCGLAALNFTAVRQETLSARLLALFRKHLPPISQTEQEALDAGTVWWDAELFSGRPDWRRLLELPAPALSAEEQAFLDGPVEALCGMLDNWQISQARDLPPAVWGFLREHGFFGIIIPRAYGGLGFSPLANSQIVMKLATRCGTAAVTVMVPNSLGPAELLLRYGTEAQKDHYLPRLARGEEIPCFALTNPYAGSDAAGIPDCGVVCHGDHQGERVLGMRVSWEKRYITLGPVATLVGLAFRLYDPEHLLGADEELGITLALLPATHPGVDIGRRHDPAGQAFQNGPTSGSDVFIPMSFVIGGRERCGQGWRMLMNCLAAGRAISLPASATAALKVASRATGAYARVRKQFNVPIGRFEGIEEPLARIAADTYAVDAARRVTAMSLEAGEEPAVSSALLKYQATERMRRALNDAMDVHGGRALICGPRNYLFSAYQSAPVSITVEGANILTRSLIVFGQGAIRCHPWLLQEIEAARAPDGQPALARFDAAIGGHARHLLMLAVRALVQNASGGLLPRRAVDGPAAPWFAEVERAAVSFALLADAALLVLGSALKRREKLSGRFADILGELYLLSCALKCFEDAGRPAADQDLLDYVCARGLHTVDRRLDEILANFPVPLLGTVLRWLIFPWGRRRKAPDDRLGHRVADLLLAPSEARDRLTAGMYLNAAPEDVLGRLEHALALTLEVEPLEKRIADARRHGTLTVPPGADPVAAAAAAALITEAEAARLRAAAQAVRAAIDVDDFAPEVLSGRGEGAERVAHVA